MKSKSIQKIKILDSCVLVNKVLARNLKPFLIDLSKNYHVLVTLHVKNETKHLLMGICPNPKDIIAFEKTLKELRDSGKIEMHPKSNRLRKSFKVLSQHLDNCRPRVERVDRHIIALACQIGSKLCSTDPGIERAISKIKKARRFRTWRSHAKNVEMQNP